WRHGKYYHTVGSKSGTAKLNEEEVLEIRSKSANGVLYKQLAKEYGVQRNTISRIVTRARWKHI
ncbi:HNH endonuclease, partial [Candidatus Pacearchaeota archaeon]|nr:HNH endonuclease [Candidatus Pacearchaeota archaeon]